MASVNESQKSGISWNDSEFLDKVQLQDLKVDMARLALQRKASVGPCSRPGMPWQEPSGIAVYLPQKYETFFNSPANAGIHIVISKGSLVRSKSVPTNKQMENKAEEMPTRISDENFSTAPHCLSVVQEKLGTMYSKIIHYFNK